MNQFVRTVTIPLDEYEELKRIAKNRKLEPFRVAANDVVSALLQQYSGNFDRNPVFGPMITKLHKQGFRIRNKNNIDFEIVDMGEKQ